MTKVKDGKWNNNKNDWGLPERINKLLAAHNLVEALLPVRVLGLCFGVVPFDFIVEPENTRAVLKTPSTVVAISVFVSCTYCAWESNLLEIYSASSFKAAVAFIAMIFIYIAVFTSRYDDARTLKILMEIGDMFGELNEKLDYTKIKNKIICRFALFYGMKITHLSVMALVTYKTQLDQHFLYSEISLNAQIMSCTALLLIFRSYVGMLQEFMKTLNRLLLYSLVTKNVYRKRVSIIHHDNFKSISNFSRKLNLICLIHSKICNCADNINGAFGNRNLFLFSLTFVHLVINVFLDFITILSWSKTTSNVNTFHSLYFLSQLTLDLCILSDVVNGCEGCRFQVILDNIF